MPKIKHGWLSNIFADGHQQTPTSPTQNGSRAGRTHRARALLLLTRDETQQDETTSAGTHLQARSSDSVLATSLCWADLKDSISPSLDRMESIMYFVGCSTVSSKPSAREARVCHVATLDRG